MSGGTPDLTFALDASGPGKHTIARAPGGHADEVGFGLGLEVLLSANLADSRRYPRTLWGTSKASTRSC